mgnify:CR=1 FL=1
MSFKKSKKRKVYSTHIQSIHPKKRYKSPVKAYSSEWEYDTEGKKVRLILK